MDEFGSGIRHRDEPTIRCVPFYNVATGTMFSLIWPLRDLENGGSFSFTTLIIKFGYSKLIKNVQEEITRDFAYGEKDQMVRKAKLYPWVEYEEDDELFQAYEQTEPDLTYFNVYLEFYYYF
jgi:hypothetical protein